MKSNHSDIHTSILERAKTSEPYNEDECRVYDGEEDPARVLATMQYFMEHGERKKASHPD